jgi:hypothetical protein
VEPDQVRRVADFAVRLFALVLALTACATSESVVASPTAPSGVTIRLREGTPPVGCEPTVVARIITTALNAINTGDQQTLAHVFSELPILSMDSRPRGTYYQFSGTQQELLAYFAERHRLGETDRLVMLDVGYASGRAQFGLSIARHAADVDGLAPGKGELDCASGRIDIWNTGQAI